MERRRSGRVGVGECVAKCWRRLLVLGWEWVRRRRRDTGQGLAAGELHLLALVLELLGELRVVIVHGGVVWMGWCMVFSKRTAAVRVIVIVVAGRHDHGARHGHGEQGRRRAGGGGGGWWLWGRRGEFADAVLAVDEHKLGGRGVGVHVRLAVGLVARRGEWIDRADPVHWVQWFFGPFLRVCDVCGWLHVRSAESQCHDVIDS